VFCWKVRIKEEVRKWLMSLYAPKQKETPRLLSIKELYTPLGDRDSSRENKSTRKIPKQVFQTWKSEYIDEKHYLNLKSYQEKISTINFSFSMIKIWMNIWSGHGAIIQSRQYSREQEWAPQRQTFGGIAFFMT
jgi:hypothetical protein